MEMIDFVDSEEEERLLGPARRELEDDFDECNEL